MTIAISEKIDSNIQMKPQMFAGSAKNQIRIAPWRVSAPLIRLAPGRQRARLPPLRPLGDCGQAGFRVP